jgi:HD-like signal output (HDOD) protein
MIRNNASVEDIAEKLESDPAITTNILKLANTAFYNAKTGSIRQAIMYIGLINVKHIILSNAVFGNDGLDPKIRDIHWQHVGLTNKILGAMYVELLGKKLNTNIASIGLLHDIGSVVLMSNFPKAFDKVVKLVSSDKKLCFVETEKSIIGFSHEELGGYLLDLWGLPYPMIEAALMHHDPLNPNIINKELVMAVHVANYYAWKAMDYTKYDNFIHRDVLHELGITQTAFDEFYVNLKTKL